MSTYNSPTTTPNFDNLLLQSLMGRLQIRPPPPTQAQTQAHHPSLSQSFEDFLLNCADPLSFSSDDDEDNNYQYGAVSPKTQLSKEESKLEKEIVKTILSGNTQTLKPNSGQAVSIGDHHICVGFHEESGSEYRVWEWHGHVMLFDEDNGYTPEYIYGNHFERLVGKTGVRREIENEKAAKAKEEKDKEEEEEREESNKVENLGLRELIDGGDSSGSRILHRSRNAGSPRFLKGSSEN